MIILYVYVFEYVYNFLHRGDPLPPHGIKLTRMHQDDSNIYHRPLQMNVKESEDGDLGATLPAVETTFNKGDSDTVCITYS